ncbi:hypothetical protein GKC30_03140 [Pseudodesulfovibrio sp. F-1]|uniref:Uncharacterized protein n=1 Tax=Pseudodesulfovibrio alkaliphilus TaxID=2661613 RepID=A0A7K1KKM8_9BACT|nr:hypothetical protein [Pseudodesulfovibrio alkaliphilus]MUM76625.1 hypothetical protein [Pseudodesulfovibrio alkaliphilus]
MSELVLALLVSGMVGVATADAFVQSWTGVLRSAAAIVLRLRGRIDGRALLSRIATALPLAMLFALAMFLFFALYSHAGLGQTEGEQFAFFLGVVPRTILFLTGASRLIETMFDPAD